MVRLFISTPAPGLPVASVSTGHIGIGTHSGVGRAIEELARFGPSVKPVPVKNLHVTLKFLGETDETSVPRIARAMAEVAGTVSAFKCNITGVGAFPNLNRPAVVWAGLDPTVPFQRLATGLNERLLDLGFDTEDRAFMPHLTLARIKGNVPEGIADWLETHSARTFGNGCVQEIELMQSIRTATGSVFNCLKKVPLAQV